MQTVRSYTGITGEVLLAALFTAYVIVVSFMDTMAQLPILAPFTASLGTGALLTGVVLGSYSLVNMAGNLVAGPVIDAYDRRVTIVAGLVIAGAAVAGYAAVSRPWHLLALRIVHGAGGAVLIPAVFAWAGDRSEERETGRIMGHAGAAVAMAAILGPALGGAGAARFGARPVFLVLGLLLCATAILITGSAIWSEGLPRNTRARKGVPGSTVRILSAGGGSSIPGPADPASAVVAPSVRLVSTLYHGLQSVLAMLRNRDLACAYRAIFGLTFAMGTLAFTMPLTMEALGFSGGNTGVLFSVSAIATIVFLLLPSNRLPDRIGPRSVIRGGVVTVVIALMMLSAASKPIVMGGIMVVYGIGFAAVFPGTTTLVVTTAGRDRRGRAFGAYYAIFSLGVFAGPIVAGLATNAGVSPYWIAAAVMIITGALPGLRGNRHE